MKSEDAESWHTIKMFWFEGCMMIVESRWRWWIEVWSLSLWRVKWKCFYFILFSLWISYLCLLFVASSSLSIFCYKLRCDFLFEASRLKFVDRCYQLPLYKAFLQFFCFCLMPLVMLLKWLRSWRMVKGFCEFFVWFCSEPFLVVYWGSCWKCLEEGRKCYVDWRIDGNEC